VSPVFRHGRLRLYLLKLLDESPRHGYEVIRLLQDRFMGVYAPSPGTIYPRLARLEEDGLVTHEDVDGKKVYSITDKGREEIRSRLADLADLEDELTESLRDVAREISEDVRDTVRTIREELASAAREFRTEGGKAGRYGSADGADASGADASSADASSADASGRDASGAGDAAAGADSPGGSGADRGDARRVREEARRRREQMRASFRAQGRSHGDWAAWAGWSGRSERPPWASWADWASGRDEPADWGEATESTHAGADSGAGASPGASASSGAGSSSRAGSAGAERPASDDSQRARRSSQNPFSDLERMAIQFATELRAAARQTGGLGERSLNDLRDILTDTLAKVRAEVFADTEPGASTSEADRTDAAAPGESTADSDSASGN
jgi:DNA-binding PadR family transcriptional regulator